MTHAPCSVHVQELGQQLQDSQSGTQARRQQTTSSCGFLALHNKSIHFTECCGYWFCRKCVRTLAQSSTCTHVNSYTSLQLIMSHLQTQQLALNFYPNLNFTPNITSSPKCFYPNPNPNPKPTAHQQQQYQQLGCSLLKRSCPNPTVFLLEQQPPCTLKEQLQLVCNQGKGEW